MLSRKEAHDDEAILSQLIRTVKENGPIKSKLGFTKPRNLINSLVDSAAFLHNK